MIDPEFEVWLGETWQRDTQAQCPDDPLEQFFEHREIEKSLGSASLREPMHDYPALHDFREFVKSEKQRVPQMTMRDIRSSTIQLLRKTADALAAI